MDISSISSNSFDLQSAIMGQLGGKGASVKANDNTAYYAKKGEPMYMDEMDSDGDGVVSIDEFKEYCHSKGMSTREIVKMAELASTYRTMKAENEAIDYVSKLTPNVSPKLKQVETNNEAVYAERGDGKYDEKMDTNSDSKITYKEYMEYCEEHAKTDESKSASSDKDFETKNAEKAIEAYSEGNAEAPDSFIDDEG